MSKGKRVDETPSGKEVIHGRPSSYNNHSCRCEECTKAWAAYMNPRIKKLRDKKKRETKIGATINLG